jgi:hypothetical protein
MIEDEKNRSIKNGNKKLDLAEKNGGRSTKYGKNV